MSLTLLFFWLSRASTTIFLFITHRARTDAKPDWLGGLSSTHQVLGSTPGGSEFQAGVKKNPLTCLHAKAHGK